MEVSHTLEHASLLLSPPLSLSHRGATDFGDTLDMQLKVQGLKEKREKMEECENELDEQCAKVRQCLENIVDDPANN